MTRLRYLRVRLAGFLVTVWAAFTLAFAYVVLTPHAEEMLGSDQVAATSSDPLLEQYAHWLWWLLTVWDQPVLEPILEHFWYTVAYLGPSMMFAIAVGVGVRVYTVGREGPLLDTSVSALTLVAVSIPVFLLALALRTSLLTTFFEVVGTVRIYERSQDAFATRNLIAALWPISAMGSFLVAVQLRYAGDALKEYASADFVKTARAKGAGSWQVGRHIFRNTAIPLLTVFFTDMLGMVVLGIVLVEYIFGIPGLGTLMVDAVLAQELPLVLGLALFTVIVGIAANFAQDAAYALFDPRIEFDA